MANRDITRRTGDGLVLAMQGRIRQREDGYYDVDGNSGSTYVVDPLTLGCTCPYSNFNTGLPCKHVFSVLLLPAVEAEMKASA